MINGVQVIRKKLISKQKSIFNVYFFNCEIFKFNPDVIHMHNTGTITFLIPSYIV